MRKNKMQSGWAFLIDVHCLIPGVSQGSFFAVGFVGFFTPAEAGAGASALIGDSGCCAGIVDIDKG